MDKLQCKDIFVNNVENRLNPVCRGAREEKEKGRNEKGQGKEENQSTLHGLQSVLLFYFMNSFLRNLCSIPDCPALMTPSVGDRHLGF